MTQFVVYKIQHTNHQPEYLAFSEHFLNSPYVTGGSEFSAFLPCAGVKYYQYVSAKDKVQAIAKAKERPKGWQWSVFNWGPPCEDTDPSYVSSDRESIRSLVFSGDECYLAKVNAQFDVSFKKALNSMIDSPKQESKLSRP